MDSSSDLQPYAAKMGDTTMTGGIILIDNKLTGLARKMKRWNAAALSTSLILDLRL